MRYRNLLICAVVVCAAMLAPQRVSAQEESVIGYIQVYHNEPCQTHYYSTSANNWFIQLGAGVNSPFVENYLPDGTQKHHLTVGYNLAFGKWMSPYLGWRISFLGGPLHYDNGEFSKMKYVSGNFDLMWDMFNSFSVNPHRTFSIVPFVGLGGTFTWDFKGNNGNIVNRHGEVKRNQWTLPVSAGVQLRFRLCSYVDFFAEGRAQFYGDNFNNTSYGNPVDINISAIGGFSFNIGGSSFRSYEPCSNLAYITALNDQINSLRSELAAATMAQNQMPCEETVEIVNVVETAPLLSSVRFSIGSDVVSPEEMVNIYNLAQWMQANPEVRVSVVGYADKDTGTSAYNMNLSQRRAANVATILTDQYGIDSSRLTISSYGSDEQPYDVNNWNRIVIFRAE